MKRFFLKTLSILCLATLALGALLSGGAQAATYTIWVAQLPSGNPVYTQGVRVWVNSDTAFGETILVQYHNITAGSWTKVDGTYDAAAYPGANWRIDIPALAAGTQVEYQVITRNQSGTEYRWSGFNWNYTVQGLPAVVYVDDGWAGTASGADPDGAGPATNFGGNAFATIQTGINGVASGGTVNVYAGTYAENVALNKTATLQGVNDPAGASAAVVNGLVNVTAGGSTVSKLKIIPAAGSAALAASASATLANNLLASSANNTTGIQVSGAGSTVDINGNTITHSAGTSYTAVLVNDGMVNLGTTSANTFTGRNLLYGSGLVVNNGTVQVEQNTFSKYAQSVLVNGGSVTLGGASWARRNTFSNTVYAFSVTGGALTVKGNSVTASIPFYQEAGTLNAYANNIAAAADGLETYGGTATLLHNWWGSNDPAQTMPTGLSAADWQARLGAHITDWAEAASSLALQGASLTGSGGTLQIVYHGDGATVANRPFGNGIEPYASRLCSDFYDLFAVGGSGAYTISLPVDNTTDCNTYARDKMALYWITAGSNYTAECSGADNKDCWDAPQLSGKTVTINGQNLEISGLTPAELGGTQFVVGDIYGSDPTAVKLIGVQASAAGLPGGAWLALLGAMLVPGVLLFRRKVKA